MDPIVLVHGYSAESSQDSRGAITAIYGDLPRLLRDAYGAPAVVEVNVSRYVTLEDGVSLDDLSRGLDRALHEDFPHLLDGTFHVVTHSTGALVVRNWLRRHSPRPAPIGNLVHLAGAQFGSGWAHLGRGQVAKWGRMVFQAGTERGVRVLNALELGASDTVDLHRHLLAPGSSTADDYQVREYVITGTQADPRWFVLPIRYAKEDGSDGVVRVAAANLNFNYLRFAPTDRARDLDWQELQRYRDRTRRSAGQGDAPAADDPGFYGLVESSRPGEGGRPRIPFAVAHACAHVGGDQGIVSGDQPREQVLGLLRLALESDAEEWSARVADFEAATQETYRRAREADGGLLARLRSLVEDPRAQYDPHAQVIVRVHDQDGHPVSHYDVYLDTPPGGTAVRTLMQDDHVNKVTPNSIVFYLRAATYSEQDGGWTDRVGAVGGLTLDVSAVEPQTEDIGYLPLRFHLDADQLTRWIERHRTTVIDIELLRLPAPDIFRMVAAE